MSTFNELPDEVKAHHKPELVESIGRRSPAIIQIFGTDGSYAVWKKHKGEWEQTQSDPPRKKAAPGTAAEPEKAPAAKRKATKRKATGDGGGGPVTPAEGDTETPNN